MRRRTLLLAAGLLAHLFGATVRVYFHPVRELCSCTEAACRVLFILEHPSESLEHPLKAVGFFVDPSCYD
jgi:hypothetical protein